MATGDVPDMLARLRATLPSRWFADTTPVLDAMLSGLAWVWSWLYVFLDGVRAQTRLATATDTQLDGISADYLGAKLPRRATEPDTSFRTRIKLERVRERATRPALTQALLDLTGRAPTIFEPSRPADTGAWGGPLGYGTAGGWGSLTHPFQCFVTAFRPTGAGIARTGGWGGPAGYGGQGATVGPIQYASLAMLTGQVTDQDILSTIQGALPTATIAWTRLSN
jgi:hypothetical protein